MLDYELKGLDAFLRTCTPAIVRGPLKKFFSRSAATVQGKAREDAPVDMGHLRNSVLYEVDDAHELPQFAKVGFLNAAEGSPLWFKARAMEFGTGRQGDPAVSHKTSHWPPGDSLSVWASRHGATSGWQVAAAIGKRGGLKARPFLRPALKNSLNAIQGFLTQLGADIQAAWEGK